MDAVQGQGGDKLALQILRMASLWPQFLMPEYLLHKNGRGRLYGDAEANANTYISKDSSASGMAKLRDCRLENRSHAEDRCQVYGGDFRTCLIYGKTIVAGSPKARCSQLDCSEVSGSPMLDSVVAVRGAEICDSPSLRGGMVAPLVLDGAIIYGSPVILGSFTVTGRVHEGTWTRAPKHIKLPWCHLSECIDGKVLLDCRCRTIDYWMRHGIKLGRRWGWSEDMISVTINTIGREFALISKAAA